VEPEPPKLSNMLAKLESDMAGPDGASLIPPQYVPPADRTAQLGRLTVNAVNSFAELPTKELDDLIAGVERKLAEIKGKAEAIKSDYVARTSELRAAVERLNQACLKGEAKMDELHSQLNEIYAPQAKPAEPPGGDAA